MNPTGSCRSARHTVRAAAGFSLLEMVVAIAILAMSLAALYRVAGGATRSVATDERMVYGVELARSLRALHAVVPAAGLDESGETEGDFRWRVHAQPLALDPPLAPGQLQALEIEVRWRDGTRDRVYRLHSVAAGREETP